MKYIDGFKNIFNRNGFHTRIVLIILFCEKKSTFSFLWKVLRKLISQCLYHCEIHPDSFSEEGIATMRMPHPYNVVIHANSRIGKNFTIFQNCTLGVVESKGTIAPQLSDNVYVGCNSVILGGG